MKQFKFSFIILFMFASFLVKADGGDSPFHQFEIGSKQFLIADNVNIRTKASTDAKIVAMLPIATELKIVGKTEELLTIRNLELNWYKVSFVKDGETQIGYVWGGLIAQEYYYDEENDVYFLFGINGYKKENGYERIEFQLRVAIEHNEIDKKLVLAFPEFSEVFFNGSQNRGIQGVENVLLIDYRSYYCAGTSGVFCFFYNKKKLYLVKELTEGFDAPYYGYEQIIFPDEECGLPNRVLWTMSSGNAEEMEPDEVDAKLYKWENLKLIEDK